MNEIKHRSELWKLLEDRADDIVRIAEIGVAEGRFSAEIINWPLPYKRVYLVDRWMQHEGQKGDGGFPQTWHNRNFEQVKELCSRYTFAQWFKMDSVKAAGNFPNGSFDLVYIDANHVEVAVLADSEAWYPKVKRNGFMAFHDYENRNYGVNKAVRLFAKKHGFEIHSIPENHSNDAGAWFQLC